jgi:hypothetical protein
LVPVVAIGFFWGKKGFSGLFILSFCLSFMGIIVVSIGYISNLMLK